MANKEQLQELANTIKESISNSIQSAFKSVVVPANANTLVQDISQSFETKNMSLLATAIEKTNTLIEKVGFNLEKFSKGINDTFEKYLAQKTASEKQVEVMKEQNILGQTELIENEIKTTTVNNKILNERKEIIQREEEQLKLKEDELNPQELVSLHKDTEYNKKRAILQKEKKSIQNTEKQNNSQLGSVIGSNRTAGGFHRLPEFLQGPVAMFTEALMAPVNIVKEIIGTFKSFGRAIKQTTAFIFGNLFLALKGLFGMFRRLRRRMRRFSRQVLFSSMANFAKKLTGLIPNFKNLTSITGLLSTALAALGVFLAGKWLKDKLLLFLFGTKGVEKMLGDKVTVFPSGAHTAQFPETMSRGKAEKKIEEEEQDILEDTQKIGRLESDKKGWIGETGDWVSKKMLEGRIKSSRKRIKELEKALYGTTGDEIEPGQPRIAPSEKQRRDRETSIQGLGRPLNQMIVTGDFSKNQSDVTSVKGETYTSGRKDIDNDDLSWKRVGAFGW